MIRFRFLPLALLLSCATAKPWTVDFPRAGKGEDAKMVACMKTGDRALKCMDMELFLELLQQTDDDSTPSSHSL